MSIFSIFIAIGDFIANLVNSVKHDYLNLEPTMKADLDGAIKFGNVLKGYIENSGSAGLVGSELINLAEGELGTGLTAAIDGVIGEVVTDLGITEVALTDPAAAYQLLLSHLSQFKGKAFADKLFNTVENIALRLTGLTDNNEVKAIIAIAYKLFFSKSNAIYNPAVSDKLTA